LEVTNKTTTYKTYKYVVLVKWLVNKLFFSF